MQSKHDETPVPTGTDQFTIDADMLAELVDAQLDEIAGGGYSQYGGFHNKDVS